MEALDFSHTVSPDEYLALESGSPLRHEYVAGRIQAMAGASPNHADIAVNLAVATQTKLDPSKCRGTSNDQRVFVEATGDSFYPDFVIKCQPYEFTDKEPYALKNPKVIFELLSKTSELYDRTVKFDRYKLISSCTDYVLIATNSVRVEHFRRGDGGVWNHETYVWRKDTLQIQSVGVLVSLEEIYSGIEIPEGMVLVESIDQDWA